MDTHPVIILGPAGRQIPNDPESLLMPIEAAHVLGLSPRTLETWRVRGGGPRYVRMSSRMVRYKRADVLDWAAERTRQSTTSGQKAEAR
jgi:predicted DNA-binding transcriptional regulator AlpA